MFPDIYVNRIRFRGCGFSCVKVVENGLKKSKDLLWQCVPFNAII